MLYNPNKSAYELLGAYYVRRKPMGLSWDKNRKYAALAYRIKGSSRFLCDGAEFNMGDGDFIYIPAGVDYCHENGEEELLVIHLLCHNETCQTIFHAHGTKEIQQAFWQVVRLWQENRSYNLTMAALYQLFEALEHRPGESDIPAVIAPGVQMLQKEFRNPELTVAQLADACFVSQVYFRRLYRQHFGISPLEAIQNLRFAYAADLLRSGYYTQKQVADLSGFSDVKYFRTAFTKHFGCTPSAYTENSRSHESTNC